MNNLAEELKKELEIPTAFTIPIGDGIAINQTVVITWCIIAVLFVVILILTRGFVTQNPGKRQVAVETFVTWIENLIGGNMNEKARIYVPYLGSVLIFLGVSNVIGIFDIAPPTKDLRTTVALALMSIILVQAASIKEHRVGGWVKGFTKPIALMTPMNILELFIKPLSLCMRLFGNVFAAFVIMELIKMVIPVGVPAVMSLYFDLFDGLLQAYVFVFLTSLYINEAVE
ncbi:MAG: F0F1 ATP synthase subunit A [Lachnospiraceae bacterium]|nr:F0F1 ATP synthase subunit A [Lachnospiraceae bacterium]